MRRPLRIAPLLLVCLVTGTATAQLRDVALPNGGTLDYLPPLRDVARPPLVAFVAASFWGLRPEQAPPIEREVARPLRVEGIAVALLHHRPAPAESGRVYAADVAAGLAWLFAEAERLGFDPERVVLAGHGSGGQLAALVALDPSYLAAHDLSPAQLSGVASISALYDLEGSEGVPEELLAYAAQAYPTRAARSEASPLQHVRGDAPPLVALAASGDIPGLAQAAKAFTAALREAGHPRAERFLTSRRDHYSVLGFGDSSNTARDHLMGLAGAGPRAAQTSELWEARRTWRDPALSSAGFWEQADLVETLEPRPEIDQWVARYFATGGGGGAGAIGERLHAVPLGAWLERMGSERVGSGRWLVVTNAKHERAVLDLEALEPYGPRIAIGIDEERNLFRVVDLYHTDRRYTWRQPEPEPWVLARPLGAFLFFEEQPPRELVSGVFGLFALTPESFARVASDPLAPVRASGDAALSRLLIEEKACVACHSFAGSGARSGHLRARDAELVGGFALPLEEYPPEVWRRYIYEQLDVAAEIGATPVVLPSEQQELLFRGVVRAREAR